MFGSRTSTLSGGPRLAITPGCASITFLYAWAEQEASLALRAVGLDPGIGIVHRDQPARDSLALDLLEAIRERAFAARDLYETRRGPIRILPPLTHQLAQTLLGRAEQLAPLAEHVAETLLAGRPTPLTQSRRSAGRDQQRRREPVQRLSAARLPSACRTCGGVLDDPGRNPLRPCLPEFRAEQRAGFSSAGAAALARIRAKGADPAHGGDATSRRSETMRRRQRQAAEWDAAPGEPVAADGFWRAILLAIQDIPLRRLADTTGLSLRYCALIRRGERVPHPRHWDSFHRGATDSGSASC